MKKTFIKILATAVIAAGIAGMGFNGKAEEKKEKAEAKEKGGSGKMPFHGKIAGVDKSAKTITVGTRTFQVTSSTQIMKGDDSAATLDDAKDGEMASGSFVDNGGKLELAKLRIGAKEKAEKKEGDDESKKKKKKE